MTVLATACSGGPKLGTAGDGARASSTTATAPTAPPSEISATTTAAPAPTSENDASATNTPVPLHPSATSTPAPSSEQSAPGPGSRPSATAVPTCAPGIPLIEQVGWIDVSGAPSLEVTPTPELRRCGLTGRVTDAWDEVLLLVPDANSPGMAEQFACHATFAPGKDVWHLEPWRPQASPGEMLVARCNPGGDDPDQAP